MTRFIEHPKKSAQESKPWPELTISEAILRLLEHRKPNLAANTIKHWKGTAKQLNNLTTRLKDLQPEELYRYQNQRIQAGIHRATVSGALGVAMLAIATARPDFKFHKAMPDPEEARQPVALTEEQITRLTTAGRKYPELHLAILLGLNGLRIHEVIQLRIEDCTTTPAGGEILIYRSKTRAGRRTLPLSDHVWKYLQDQISRLNQESGPVFPHRYDPNKKRRTFKTSWTELRKQTGLTEVRFHDLRHTYITRLAEAGVPDWTIRAMAGHVDERMLQHYSHIRKDATREALRRMEAEGKIQ